MAWPLHNPSTMTTIETCSLDQVTGGNGKAVLARDAISAMKHGLPDAGERVFGLLHGPGRMEAMMKGRGWLGGGSISQRLADIANAHPIALDPKMLIR